MTTAFHGNSAVKAELLDRIDRHIADGTLETRWVGWRDGRGSPLGVAIEGDDPARYSEIYGYPIALAGLLDPLAAMISDPAEAASFARAWVADVEPGTDLAPTASAIVLDLLHAEETRDLAPSITDPLIALHRREMSRELVAPSEWRRCRAMILSALDNAPPRRLGSLLELCEAACWPVRSSRSILATLAAKWCDLSELVRDPDWSDTDRDQAEALLTALALQHNPENGNGPGIPRLFWARSPDLARRFEANLCRVNQRRPARVLALAKLVLSRLRAEERSSCPRAH